MHEYWGRGPCGRPHSAPKKKKRAPHSIGRPPPQPRPLSSLTPFPHSPTPLPSPLSVPDGAARCKAEWAIARSTWARRADLPSGEAGMYALFVGELFAWACVGEIVGRGGTFGGYAV